MGCRQVVRQQTLTLLSVGSNPPIPVFYNYSNKYNMSARIQFIEGVKEEILPIIKLTKSRNGKTGTGTFIFINPNIFEYIQNSNAKLENISLIWENQQIESKNLEIYFKNGKPFLIKSIFIFKNSKEWFNFLNFMNYYSKETGLLFTDKNFLN